MSRDRVRGDYTAGEAWVRMVDSSELEALDRSECLALLATARVGRVVFTDRALPAVRPARFTLLGDLLRLQPIPQSGGVSVIPDTVLAFEVDAFDPDLTRGWFVVVLGRAAGAAIRIEVVQGWRLVEQ